MKKFSEAICELSETWMQWIKYDPIARNESFSIAVRKEAAIKCEELIKKTYVLMDVMNVYFDKEPIRAADKVTIRKLDSNETAGTDREGTVCGASIRRE